MLTKPERSLSFAIWSEKTISQDFSPPSVKDSFELVATKLPTAGSKKVSLNCSSLVVQFLGKVISAFCALFMRDTSSLSILTKFPRPSKDILYCILLELKLSVNSLSNFALSGLSANLSSRMSFAVFTFPVTGSKPPFTSKISFGIT